MSKRKILRGVSFFLLTVMLLCGVLAVGYGLLSGSLTF